MIDSDCSCHSKKIEHTHTHSSPDNDTCRWDGAGYCQHPTTCGVKRTQPILSGQSISNRISSPRRKHRSSSQVLQKVQERFEARWKVLVVTDVEHEKPTETTDHDRWDWTNMLTWPPEDRPPQCILVPK